MNRFLLCSSFALMSFLTAEAQITITHSNMPVNGDSLRHSYASPVGSGVDLSITGTNMNWNYSTLVPIAQGVDQYKFAAAVNATYALTISPTAYGYKVADSLAGASQ